MWRANFVGTKFGGGVQVLRAERAIIRSFAQKMFELRSKTPLMLSETDIGVT